MKHRELNNGERRIKKIGGALDRDYRYLCGVVETINADYFPLFSLLGFTSPEDTDIVIETLLKDYIFIGAKEMYIARETERINTGKLKLENILTKRTLNKEYPTSEERDRAIQKEIHRALAFRYNKIEQYFRKEFGYSLGSFNKFPLKICRKALSLSSEGFTINEERFIEIYGDYLEANGSQTGKHHQEAADAINRFFNGQIQITESELEKYFVIEHGLVKPNPKSINREYYLRLGYSGSSNTTK